MTEKLFFKSTNISYISKFHSYTMACYIKLYGKPKIF